MFCCLFVAYKVMESKGREQKKLVVKLGFYVVVKKSMYVVKNLVNIHQLSNYIFAYILFQRK